MVQWLGPGTFSAEGPGSILGWGTNILQAVWSSQEKKKKKERERENKLKRMKNSAVL